MSEISESPLQKTSTQSCMNSRWDQRGGGGNRACLLKGMRCRKNSENGMGARDHLRVSAILQFPELRSNRSETEIPQIVQNEVPARMKARIGDQPERMLYRKGRPVADPNHSS
jgi:hypothetical protein